MHVLITGGTGLIGTALARSLLADGHQVTVLSRSPDRKRDAVPSGAHVAGWDARTAAGWGALADGADAIVNLAGAGLADRRWTEARKRTIRESRINAGAAVSEAIRQASQKPKVVVQASGINYYGPGGDRILTEEDPPGRDFLAQLCVEWESSTASVHELGVRRPVTRSGVVLSTQGGALPRMLLPFRLFVGGPLGRGRQYFPWIHIDDEVRAIRYLIESENADGPYNLVAPDPPTNREFMAKLGRAMHRPALMPVPAFALQLLFGEMSIVLLEGQRAVPQRLERAGFDFAYTDAEPALRDVLTQHK